MVHLDIWRIYGELLIYLCKQAKYIEYKERVIFFPCVFEGEENPSTTETLAEQ